LRVHRSAPVGRGLTWRSLGRSLRANVNACAAQLAPLCGAASSPTRYYNKNRSFQRFVRIAAINTKKLSGAASRASSRPTLENGLLGRAWCGHARPTTTLGAGKILPDLSF